MVGKTVSGYKITRELGRGAMGVVWEATDIRLGRTVAIKFLPDGAGSEEDKTALGRFLRGAKVASTLNHPNICTIYAVVEDDERPFIVMELLEGETLKDRIGRKRLDVTEMIMLSGQLADALDAAHEKRVLHRDIKPGNIFVTKREQAKILDFGLAKKMLNVGESVEDAETEGGEVLTKLHTVLGTLPYMSPEQLRGEELTSQSDIFSFGAVLYEMATGRRAFDGKTAADTQAAILEKEPVSPLVGNPALPRDFERIVFKALKKDRRLRYRSIGEMSVDLRLLTENSRDLQRETEGASGMRVFSRWNEQFLLDVMASARDTITILDSNHSEALFLETVLRRAFDSGAEHLRVMVYVLDPLKPFGQQRLSDKRPYPDTVPSIRKYSQEFEDNRIDILDAAETIRKTAGRDLQVGICSYPTMPGFRIIAIDKTKFIFGWFPLHRQNPNFYCCYLSKNECKPIDQGLIACLEEQLAYVANEATDVTDTGRLEPRQ
jgi:serine/threonine protein kinase